MKKNFKKGGKSASRKERITAFVLSLIDGLARSVTKAKKPKRKSILVVKVDLLGDYILHRNFFEALKNHTEFIDHSITFCCNKAIRGLSEKLDTDVIDRWISVPFPAFVKEPKKRLAAWSQILDTTYDLAIFPTASRSYFYDDLIAKNCRALRKIGNQGNTHNHFPWQARQSQGYFDQFAEMPQGLLFEFDLNKAFYENYLAKKLPYHFPTIQPLATKNKEFSIIISPGASAAFRQWPVAMYVEVMRYLLEKKPVCQIQITGSPAEKSIGLEIKSFFEEDPRVENICGKAPLKDLPDLLASADLLIANESGVIHLAKALGVGLIYCISNGNHYGRFNPYPEYQNEGLLRYFYPKAIRELKEKGDEDELKNRYYWGSREDISTIKSKDLVAALKEDLV